jgi:peptidyl-prolyl cis-trans isomerase A (cyclophilin A)
MGVTLVNRSTSCAVRRTAAAGFFLFFAFAGASLHAAVVRFHTSAGDIDVRLYDGAAPLNTANFLNYATSNRYDGTFVHRVAQNPGGGTANFVVQGGGYQLNNSIFAATGIALDPPVVHELSASNLRGTLAAAHAANPDGAQSQWYFNVGNNSFLDTAPSGPFTVFGRIVGAGMLVVDTINNLAVINASAAQNAPGESFSEVPVFDVNKVLQQGDITNLDAVIVHDVETLNLTDGDYNFDGVVDQADLAVWTSDQGSTTKAEADGNGNGVVDQADFDIWQAHAVPEPGSLAAAMAAAVGMAALRRRGSR